MFNNCFTATVKHGPTADGIDLHLFDGIEAFDYRFASGGEAKFVFIGGRTERTNGQRIQLRISDDAAKSLVRSARPKQTNDGESTDREVQLMQEAQFIEMRDGRKFFGVSADWHRRAPEGTDPSDWMPTLPTEGYIMLISQADRTRVEGGTVLQEGFTEKYGEIFNQVRLIRVRLGEVATLIVVGADGSEAAFELTYDAKSVNARRV